MVVDMPGTGNPQLTAKLPISGGHPFRLDGTNNKVVHLALYVTEEFHKTRLLPSCPLRTGSSAARQLERLFKELTISERISQACFNAWTGLLKSRGPSRAPRAGEK